MKTLTLISTLSLGFLSGAFAQNHISTDTANIRGDNKHLIVLSESGQTEKEKTAYTSIWDTLEVQVTPAQDNQAVNNEESPQIFAATLDAGRTEATLDVSASGGSTYTLPFQLPPGINDVVPQLGLMYNSQGANGIAGYGWNVYGLSSIARVGGSHVYR